MKDPTPGAAVRVQTDLLVIRPAGCHQEEPMLGGRASVKRQPGRRVAAAGRGIHSFPAVWRSLNQSVSVGHAKKLRNESERSRADATASPKNMPRGASWPPPRHPLSPVTVKSAVNRKSASLQRGLSVSLRVTSFWVSVRRSDSVSMVVQCCFLLFRKVASDDVSVLGSASSQTGS